MSSLRDKMRAATDNWLHQPDGGQSMDELVSEGTDVAMAVFESELAVKDAEIERLGAERDRLIEQVRTVRTLQAMWAKLGVHAMPDQRGTFARVAEDLAAVLGQPKDSQ